MKAGTYLSLFGIATGTNAMAKMSTLNLESARSLARARIEELAQAAGDEFQILHDPTEEIEIGWIFFYNTTEFVQTKNFSSALAGNGPILVTRAGAVHELPSAIPWRDAVNEI
ncbi:MAG: YrhB domain-containing protein [Lysobacter sp.]